jgi:hypothetical protein
MGVLSAPLRREWKIVPKWSTHPIDWKLVPGHPRGTSADTAWGRKGLKKLLTGKPTGYTFMNAIHKRADCRLRSCASICHFPHHIEQVLIR